MSLWLACTVVAYAQTAEPPEVLRAREEVRTVQALVDAGALPPARLTEARELLEDAEDEAVLRRTLFGSISVEGLTEEQADEMVAAARRRVERHQTKVEKGRERIEAGAVARKSLAPLLEEEQRRAEILELALSRAELVRELSAMALAEQALELELSREPAGSTFPVERFAGSGVFHPGQLDTIIRAFAEQFQESLPISAHGDTAVHRSLGFDHRGRVDVALDPDKPRGVWLRQFLQAAGIPYYAFRSSIPGKSTAPHIHIGPPSARIQAGN
jgi:HAMP domain-containing protein